MKQIGLAWIYKTRFLLGNKRATCFPYGLCFSFEGERQSVIRAFVSTNPVGNVDGGVRKEMGLWVRQRILT